MFKVAKWIWYKDSSTPNSFGEFFGKFNSEGNATCKISCDGDYTLFINGKYVASNQYGDFEHYKSVDTIDISDYLINGENSASVLVWHFGKDTQRYKKYAPGLIFEIENKGEVLLCSDENILARESKAYESGFAREISPQLGFSYKYDSAKEDLWTLGKGNGLKNACLINKSCTFIPRPNKKLILKAFVSAKLVSHSKNQYVFDLGKEYVGLLRFELFAKSNAYLNISYGECLENGHVKRKIGNRDFSIDYIAKEGKNSHTSYMLRFACRYIEVCSDAEIQLETIGLIPQCYPTIRKSRSFLTGIDRSIYDICLNTLELSMMEHYVDCPWREQCLYAFDSRNQMLSGYYAFSHGNFEYAKSNLTLISMDKRDDGLLSICAPCGVNLTIPSFSLYYIVAVWEYIEHSGDKAVVNIVGEKLKEIINTFVARLRDGLVCTFTMDCHWNFYDWSPYLDGYIDNSQKGKPDAMINLLFVYALQSYQKICDACNLPFEYNSILQNAMLGIRKLFFHKENGIFLTEKNGRATELVNSLSIITGVSIGREAEKIGELLSKKELISCSLSMKCFVYDALIKISKDTYKDFILEDIRNSYKPMIETGTVWETLEGSQAFDNAGSLCHGWSSTPIYYYNKLK